MYCKLPAQFCTAFIYVGVLLLCLLEVNIVFVESLGLSLCTTLASLGPPIRHSCGEQCTSWEMCSWGSVCIRLNKWYKCQIFGMPLIPLLLPAKSCTDLEYHIMLFWPENCTLKVDSFLVFISFSFSFIFIQLEKYRMEYGFSTHELQKYIDKSKLLSNCNKIHKHLFQSLIDQIFQKTQTQCAHNNAMVTWEDSWLHSKQWKMQRKACKHQKN